MARSSSRKVTARGATEDVAGQCRSCTRGVHTKDERHKEGIIKRISAFAKTVTSRNEAEPRSKAIPTLCFAAGTPVDKLLKLCLVAWSWSEMIVLIPCGVIFEWPGKYPWVILCIVWILAHACD